MIDAERMLGKMLSGMVGGTVSGKKKRKGRKNDITSVLASGLTSGKGLMTLVGLGVGAYTVLTGEKSSQSAGSQGRQPMPPPPPQTGVGQVPPPVPGGPGPAGSMKQAVPAAGPQVPKDASASALAGQGGDIALRIIQAMIAAAAADGEIDAEEESRILEKLRDQGLSREEKQLLLAEMHQPKSIEHICQGIADPAAAQLIYRVAAAAVEIDTEAERRWFDALGDRLGLSASMRSFIEEM